MSTTNPQIQRWRLVFAKTEAMRYTGNLDVQRTLERMFRRADLPLLHSRGYNPRPKMHIASALPLGVTGRAELMDFWLERPLPADEIRRRLEQVQPPGLRVVDLYPVPLNAPALQNQVRAAAYEARLLRPVPDLAQRVAALLAREHIPRERRGKAYDLRPLVEALEVRPPAADEPGPRLHMVLTARPGATGRPDEVLAALGLDPAEARVERLRLFLEEETQNAGSGREA
ncbi:MAG: DUF2344 domain-containing protein [Chloroflexi bacterium]|nr:DUF2344 domain-containing protein [Chloroflexota bacterium]